MAKYRIKKDALSGAYLAYKGNDLLSGGHRTKEGAKECVEWNKKVDAYSDKKRKPE